jgi:putative ABC transport system permease protein
MTFGILLQRNLRFHFPAHLGVVLGAGVGAAVLCGALIIGDSMRFSLQESAVRRLGPAHYAMFTADRLVTSGLVDGIRDKLASAHDPSGTQPILSALTVPGTAARQDGTARVNNLQVLGVDDAWVRNAGWLNPTNAANAVKDPPLTNDQLQRWREGLDIFLNATAARELNANVGDELVVRIRKPEFLGLDAAISPRHDLSLALRFTVGPIVSDHKLGAFSLTSGRAAANGFLPMTYLQAKLGLTNQLNLVLAGVVQIFKRNPNQVESAQEGVQTLNSLVKNTCSLSDAQLDLFPVPGGLELRSSRIFLDDATVDAALAIAPTNAVRLLTYLATMLRCGDKAAPYSMVTAVEGAYLPPQMRDDEMAVNEWLAEDLGVQTGALVAMSYFVVDAGSRLVERTNTFKVREIVPLSGAYADPTLMPDFPGVAKAESTHDWDAGFPLTYKIREKDEAYWKAHRGTPKAFITLAAGHRMWGNRFGNLSSIRFPLQEGALTATRSAEISERLLGKLEPAKLGLAFAPVRARALQSVGQSQDFGELFLGFSIFLVVSALLLVGLFFQLNLERRSAELGTLLALGFTASMLRRLLILEGLALAVLGSMIGVLGGLAFAKGMLWGLGTIWKSAVGVDQVLAFHLAPRSPALGLLASILASTLAIWLTLRKQVRRSVVRLLSGAHEETPFKRSSRGRWLGYAALFFAGGLVLWSLTSGRRTDPGIFFGVGCLMLCGGLGLALNWLIYAGRAKNMANFTLGRLALRGSARRRKRSLATIALLACGSFLILAVGAFRQDAARDGRNRSSGTGGFTLIGETALPILEDLNSKAGRENLALDAREFSGVRFIPFRVRSGDEASCLNLNRVQHPRILGVDPSLLKGLKAFTFQKVIGKRPENSWDILEGPESQQVPAVADANSIEWSLGKKLGQSLSDKDQQGRPVDFLLSGALANSILQGSLIISETNFTRLFPGISGYQFFLIDVPAGTDAKSVSAGLSRALQDYGLAIVPATARLAEFNAVENTYLSAFQLLGGIGLLLGSAGIGLVVLRNVWERRAELGLLLAMGFSKSRVRQLVIMEHAALLAVGLVLGIVAAAVAVSPALFTPGMTFPAASLGLTLLGVLASGLLCTWVATHFALRGNLLKTLQNE